MIFENTTQMAMVQLANYGITDQFLFRVSGYSELLIQDARNGNLVLLGHSLERMESLVQACEQMEANPEVHLSPSEFLENAILTFEVDGQEVDGIVGMMVSNGQITPEAAVKAAEGLHSIPVPPPFYKKPERELHWPKAGIRQVW